MGLSVTATYGIIFTASLLLFGVLLNSLLYAYDNFQDGLNNKIDIIENEKNLISIKRVVYNDGNVEIIALNEGPKTLETEKMTILLNGTPVNFSSEDYWYPGEVMEFFINSSYSLGYVHDVQFSIPIEGIASSESDKIYIINETTLFAYYYNGTLAWERSIDGPRDVSSSSLVYVLNGTGILELDENGQLVRFLSVTNLTSLGSRGPYIYAVNSSNFIVMNNTGEVIKKVNLTDGKDVAVGKEVYVLDGNEVKLFDYYGNYEGTIVDPRLSNAIKISADSNAQGDYLLVLTRYGSILVYDHGAYVGSIPLSVEAINVDLYGKIYICGPTMIALNSGYRVKMVDEYGNEVYGFL